MVISLKTAKEKCDRDPLLWKFIMIQTEIQLKRVFPYITTFVQFQVSIHFICFLNDPFQIRTQLISTNDIDII